MPYQRQHFVNGNRLFAEQLTHIEDGLIHLDDRIDKMIEEGVEMDIGFKWENIEDVPETFPPEEHNHDETYAPKEHEHSQYLTQHQDISGKANASDLTSHTGNTTAHITADERTKWNGKADKADIATTAMQGTAEGNTTYWKISDFGNWGTGNWTQKGFSMIVTSRAGEMIWVSLAANDSNTSAGAIRLINRYSKIAALHYSVSESAIYATAAAWANNICAHIISNVNGDYVPKVAKASALPSDAVAINIVELGIDGTGTVVGDSSVPLALGGSADRPTYNGSNMALQSEIPTDYLSLSDGKIVQGNPSADSTIASMNRFQSDLFIEGNGSAPNNPQVAGFYLGKSATDENRHLDIVSGADYSYIDFNKASSANDFTARILVNVVDGNTLFDWGGNATNRTFNVNGTLMQCGSPVSVEGHSQAASTITAGTFAGQVVANSGGQAVGTSLLRNSKLVSADTNPTVNGEICWTYG